MKEFRACSSICTANSNCRSGCRPDPKPSLKKPWRGLTSVGWPTGMLGFEHGNESSDEKLSTVRITKRRETDYQDEYIGREIPVSCEQYPQGSNGRGTREIAFDTIPDGNRHLEVDTMNCYHSCSVSWNSPSRQWRFDFGLLNRMRDVLADAGSILDMPQYPREDMRAGMSKCFSL